MPEKQALSAEQLDAQAAFELPDRAMMQLVGPILVNVDLGDVAVQVPVGVAANLCDINAAVLLAEIEDTGSAECTATAEPTAGQGGGPPANTPGQGR